jgi:DNA-binding transcriptional LysR family regulator
MDGLELDTLRAFAVFAEHRNFTAAAAVLRISQPALHVKVGKLAQVLGVALYRREGPARPDRGRGAGGRLRRRDQPTCRGAMGRTT